MTILFSNINVTTWMNLKSIHTKGSQGLMSIILATQEAEIRRIAI
jgi:hypothetical protein